MFHSNVAALPTGIPTDTDEKFTPPSSPRGASQPPSIKEERRRKKTSLWDGGSILDHQEEIRAKMKMLAGLERVSGPSYTLYTTQYVGDRHVDIRCVFKCSTSPERPRLHATSCTVTDLFSKEEFTFDL